MQLLPLWGGSPASANVSGVSAPGGDKRLNLAERVAETARSGAPARPLCPAWAVQQARVLMLVLSLLFQGLCIARMKLFSVALMFLGSLAFLGADTARLDVASEFKKK